MRLIPRLLFILLAIMSFVACEPTFENVSDSELYQMIQKASPTGSKTYFVMPNSDDYANIPNQDIHNQMTKAKVDLGKMLFFEPGIAQHPKDSVSYETFSCGSCHVPERGFLPGRIQGIADGGFGFGTLGSSRAKISKYSEEEIDAQGTRPLTVMNAAFVTNTLWSGMFGANDKNIGTDALWTGNAEVNKTGLNGLEAQNIENFNIHRLDINQRVLENFGYKAMFDQAFPEVPAPKRYSLEIAGFALSSYLRSLMTNEAPFQTYLKGNNYAITEKQKLGAKMFFGKGECITCHSGPSFSAVEFFVLGTKDLYEAGGLKTSASDPRNLGRAFFTKRKEDEYKFKVPQLYNLKDYATYFHGSSKTSLESVIDFKMNAKSEHANIPDEMMDITPKSLTYEEKDALIDFLRNALYDANMRRYVPVRVMSGMCFPNNDKQSKEDMGCK